MQSRSLLRLGDARLVGLAGLAAILFCPAARRVDAGDWPVWRYDAGRTGVSPESLPAELHLQWTRALPPVTPAFSSKRLQFDRGYEPVVLGRRMFVAQPHNDSVVAYDTRTGAEHWRFHADGPVRCAPVAWRDRLYFGSDDGFVYCLDALDGACRWRFRAVPSSRKVLGNGRLISVWPVRGGPVLADGVLYFAAGVWPFEGVFIYAIDAETGDVVWRNDRTGFLYGTQPHNCEAMGGLSPQGYLLVDGDDLVVPCGTARPAVFDRRTGALKAFSLPGEGRLPGGWFMALDPQQSRDARRGKLVFDSEVNRELHEDKWYVGLGTPGVRSRVSIGGKTLNFSDGVAGVAGEIHTMLAADSRLFVVALDGTIRCFGAEETVPRRYTEPPAAEPTPENAWSESAEKILAGTRATSGYALVLGVENGRLAEALVARSELSVIALARSPRIRAELRERFDKAGVPAGRLAVHCGTLDEMDLPPYLASLVVAEDWNATGLAEGGEFLSCLFERLQPHGGVAFLDGPDVDRARLSAWSKDAQLENAEIALCQGAWLLRRVGALPGAVDYSGGWIAPDERVGAPLGLLWYNDAVRHFKRAPQPLFVKGVMISRDKDWTGEGMLAGPGPRMHFPGTGRFYLTPPNFSDMYTGRLLSGEKAIARIGEIPQAMADDARPPYQYRPPFVNDPPAPGSTNKPALPFHREVARGEMINPMTGTKEPRRFVKSYGCDGGNDYGRIITMRSATAAFYDKRIESGTINISGPRSGCTNSIIPAGGLLNIPFFYDGCTCSYPLPAGAALVRMPASYEQWTAWKGNDQSAPIQRVGINLGAPGDRVTDAGTLWLDYPSVGGPSPNVDVAAEPESAEYFYRHSLWSEGGTGWPWVCASGAVGLSQLKVNGLRQGAYTVRLYFAEPEASKPGHRVFSVSLQGKEVLGALDVAKESGGAKRSLVKEFTEVEVVDGLRVDLTAEAGATVLSGVEIVRDGLPLDSIGSDRTSLPGRTLAAVCAVRP